MLLRARHSFVSLPSFCYFFAAIEFARRVVIGGHAHHSLANCLAINRSLQRSGNLCNNILAHASRPIR